MFRRWTCDIWFGSNGEMSISEAVGEARLSLFGHVQRGYRGRWSFKGSRLLDVVIEDMQTIGGTVD